MINKLSSTPPHKSENTALLNKQDVPSHYDSFNPMISLNIPSSNEDRSENLRQHGEAEIIFAGISDETGAREHTREEIIEGTNTLNKWGSLKALMQLTCLFLLSAIIVYVMLLLYLPPLDEYVSLSSHLIYIILYFIHFRFHFKVIKNKNFDYQNASRTFKN